MKTLAALFAVGLLGSPHCLGMCGGFVAAYSLRTREWAVIPHLAFIAGRMITLVLLGLLAGAAGWGLGRSTQTLGVQAAYAWIFGGLMVLLGLAQLGLAPVDRLAPRLSQGLERRTAAVLRAGAEGQSATPILLLGMMIGLLPCHLSYGALAMSAAAAAALGNPLIGAAGMAFFVLGTAPLLVFFGLGARSLGAAARGHIVRVAAAALIIAGGWTIYRSFPAGPTCCPAPAQTAQPVKIEP